MGFIKRVSGCAVLILLKTGILISKQTPPQIIEYATHLQNQFIQEMADYGLVCIGKNGGYINPIKTFYLSFVGYRRATLEEARALEVFAIEKLTNLLNSDEKIRPYLCEFPFPAHRVEISLSFDSPFGSHYADESIAYVFYVRNRLFYNVYDPITEELVTLCEEPYADAKKILENKPVQDPFIHQVKPQEPLIDTVLFSYLQEMGKKYEMECHAFGGKWSDKIEDVIVKLIYFHPTQIEKARELQVVATEKLSEAINSNEKLRPYIKNYPMSLDRLKVTVLFKKPNYFSYSDGTLHRVERHGEEVIYYIRPPRDENTQCYAILSDDKLPIFAQESYHEAVQKVQETPRGKKLKIQWHLDKKTVDTTISPTDEKIEK